MATTDIMDLAPVSEVKFIPRFSQEMSLEAGGDPRVADVGEELWIAEIGCSVVTRIEARRLEARINALRGGIGTFYVWNPRAPYPYADLDGSILGASAVTIYALGGDSKSLRLAGLPVGYQITEGDYFHFETGSAPVRRCLHHFTADAVADAFGRIALTGVFPHLRAGVATGLAVTLKKPAAEMFILPGSYDAHSTRPPLGAITFHAMQVP